MSDVLPELKKGDVLVKVDDEGRGSTLTIIRVGRGTDFDEPVYYRRGMYGVKIKKPYAGEELAALGYRLKNDEQKACQVLPIG